MDDTKISLTMVAGIIVYAVSISAYVFGLRGDVNRLEQSIERIDIKLSKVTNKTLDVITLSTKHEQDLYYILNGCCSDMIAESITILKDKNTK